MRFKLLLISFVAVLLSGCSQKDYAYKYIGDYEMFVKPESE